MPVKGFESERHDARKPCQLAQHKVKDCPQGAGRSGYN